MVTLCGSVPSFTKRNRTRVPAFADTRVGVNSSVLLYAGLGALMSDTHVTWLAVSEILPTAVLYDVVLSAFVVPAVLVLVDRVEPDPMARR